MVTNFHQALRVVLAASVALGSSAAALAGELSLNSSPALIGGTVTLRTEGGTGTAFYALCSDVAKGRHELPGGAILDLGLTSSFMVLDRGGFDPNGVHMFDAKIPNDPALVGAKFYAQGIMFSFLTFSLTTSNTIEITIDKPGGGIFTSPEEVKPLAMSGDAWAALLDEANQATGSPDLSNQDDDVNVRVLAKALVFARTGEAKYRSDVIKACMDAIGTEAGGRALAFGRELGAYVIAADLVKLPAAEDQKFRDWIRMGLTENLSGRTLTSTHEDRPNNWGTQCGGARLAVAVYLGDEKEIARCAQVFKGYLGDRESYAAFTYGDLSWQADSKNPVGINPKGTTRDGHSIDGVLPDDQRRAGGFKWPPPKENYAYGAMQGALLQAILLDRLGYDVWNWEDRALLRAFNWLHEECHFDAEGDDTWQPHVINHFYGVNLPAPKASTPGKNIGWTCWLYSGAR